MNNGLITKSPFKVVSYGGSLVSRTTQHTFLLLSLKSPTPPAEYLNVQKLPSTFMAEHDRTSHLPYNSKFSCGILDSKWRWRWQASDANWLRAHAWHVTIFFWRFSKYFSGFHVDFLIREKIICGSNIFIRICNSFLDLTNFPTGICKKYCDLKIFFGFENYFWIVPSRLPYNSNEILKNWNDNNK